MQAKASTPVRSLLVGTNHQRVECRVNLPAGARVTLLCLHVSMPGSDGQELTPLLRGLLPLDATRSSPVGDSDTS
jgi:hypothetical protein